MSAPGAVPRRVLVGGRLEVELGLDDHDFIALAFPR